MSIFYAMIKGVNDEIDVFNSSEERDDWLNCRGKFDYGCSKAFEEEGGTFRIPLTERQAKYRIKAYELIKSENEEDIVGNKITMYLNPYFLEW